MMHLFIYNEGVSKVASGTPRRGQKLIAQGSALGVTHPKAKRPVREKALIMSAFSLTGRIIYNVRLPRRCPGLGANWAFSPHCLSFDTPSFFKTKYECCYIT